MINPKHKYRIENGLRHIRTGAYITLSIVDTYSSSVYEDTEDICGLLEISQIDYLQLCKEKFDAIINYNTPIYNSYAETLKARQWIKDRIIGLKVANSLIG